MSYESADRQALTRQDSHIVITIGFATQIHWLVVVREDLVSREDGSYQELEYATMLFQFWKHSFYKLGGTGAIPRGGRRILGYIIQPDIKEGLTFIKRQCGHCGQYYRGGIYKECYRCHLTIGVENIYQLIISWFFDRLPKKGA